MDEKTIVESKLINIKAIAIALFAVIVAVPNLILFLVECQIVLDWFKDSPESIVSRYGTNSRFAIALERYLENYFEPFFLIFLLGGAAVALIFYFMFHKTKITVTSKRVYGQTAWGKRVDLPLDMISATGTSLLKGIAVSTSSGKIKFVLIQNRDEIHDAISKLLMERQSKATAATTAKPKIPKSGADELKEFKELLDSGVISQEEFDTKKKQLLGL